MFLKMPHGNDLDMTSKTTLDGFDISFDYKFSTMKFERYTYDPTQCQVQEDGC
jgi:hypothetical protein